jgi:class II lanthipeptide synthase
VGAALRAVAICGGTQYAWMGHRSRRLPPTIDGVLDAAQRRLYLVACLRDELYHSFYCYGRPVPARRGEPQPPFADPWLLEALSRANRGRGSWEHGWTVESVDDGEVVVADARLRVRVPSADCRAARIEPGTAVSVRLPKELPALSPGFWFAVSDAPAATFDVRVYWNVTHAGAPALVEALTSRLNGDGVPFRLKVADHPYRFGRCDAAVLYLDARAFRTLRPTLREVAAELALEPSIPAFTLELAPGVGLAEDDGGESFGARRCALLAEAIVYAREASPPIAAVAARFAEAGVDIDAPYRSGRDVL